MPNTRIRSGLFNRLGLRDTRSRREALCALVLPVVRHAANGERACRLGQLCLPEVIQPRQSQQDWDCKNSQENQDTYYLAYGLRNLKASIHSRYAMHFL
jgi:hypothetical protein